MVVRGAACRCGAGTLGQPGQPGQPGGDKGGGPGGNMARGYCPPASHLTFPLLPDPPARPHPASFGLARSFGRPHPASLAALGLKLGGEASHATPPLT